MISLVRVRSGRRYSRYLALQIVRRAADSANKHDHDIINGSVLCQLRAINAISSEIMYW